MSIIQQVAQAVMKKAVELAPDAWMPGGTPDPLMFDHQGLIGAPVSRLDGPLKVRGEARFAAEFDMEGMVYASLAYSAVPQGRIAQLDTSEAEAAPGVVLVMTHKNAPRMKSAPLFMSEPKAASGDNLAAMQDDRIHWNGQPIAVVLAETQEQADHARSFIHATYDAQPAATDFEKAKSLPRQPGIFAGEPLKSEINDAERSLAAAMYKIDETYSTPRQNHNAIEPHAATLAWHGDELTVHDASQGVAHTAWSLAEIFGIAEGQVHVMSPFVGGAFGGKCLWQHQILAAAASRLAGRPVRVALSREGVYRLVGGRANTEQRVATGARADGRFQALIHTGVVASTRQNNVPEPFILPAQCVYAADSFKLGVEVVYLDSVANTFMRAPGEAVGSFALESAVDELSEKLGLDPIELRMINEAEKDPMSGLPFSARHLVEAYRSGAGQFGWSKRDARPGARQEGEWLVGMGCATATYPYVRMPGGAARLTLTQAGHATVQIAAHEMGMGTATVHAQVTAARMGLGIGQVTIAYGDSRFPGVVLAGGSQQTAAIGATVIAAHRALVAELLKHVGKESALSGLKPEEVGSRDCGLCKLDEPGRFESYASILEQAELRELTVEASAPTPLEMGHWSMHSFGAMFCEVRVNSVTGETRIARFLGSFDCGRILNPKTAASQFRGGIVMGLGLALMEETQFDKRNGRIMNPNLAEYHLPAHMDVPEIDVIWTDIPDPHAPMGAHGVGEIGITGVGAAVANAIYNACGKRVRSLPITLDKLL